MSDETSYNELGQQIFDDLAALELSPIPEHYEVWFRHLEGRQHELSDAINERLNNQLALTSQFMLTLYENFCRPAEIPQEAISVVVNSVAKEATALESLAGEMASSAESFSDEVETASASITTDKLSEIELRRAMAALANTAANALSRNRSLEERLDAAIDNIADLRTNLETLEERAYTDFLTNLNNRRRFDQLLETAIQDAAETDEPLSLIVCDIDHFKAFNDNFGHQVGDQVLVLVADVLKKNTKGQDIVARFGGEEFILALPNTPLKAACELAEVLRKTIATRKLISRATHQDLGKITMSFGVAEFAPSDTRSSLFESADRALYEAKRTGRNKVVSSLSQARDCA